MERLKFIALAVLIAVGVLGAGTASAQNHLYQVWNGATQQWSFDGDTHLVGPVTIVAAALVVQCNADFTVVVRKGFAFVRNAKFSGSSVCLNITSSNLAWVVSQPVPYGGANPPGAPLLSPTLWTVAISEVSINGSVISCPVVGGPTIIGVLDEGDQLGSPPAFPVANRFVFSTGTGVCSIRTNNNSAMVATIPMRVVPANC